MRFRGVCSVPITKDSNAAQATMYLQGLAALLEDGDSDGVQ